MGSEQVQGYRLGRVKSHNKEQGSRSNVGLFYSRIERTIVPTPAIYAGINFMPIPR